MTNIQIIRRPTAELVNPERAAGIMAGFNLALKFTALADAGFSIERARAGKMFPDNIELYFSKYAQYIRDIREDVPKNIITEEQFLAQELEITDSYQEQTSFWNGQLGNKIPFVEMLSRTKKLTICGQFMGLTYNPIEGPPTFGNQAINVCLSRPSDKDEWSMTGYHAKYLRDFGDSSDGCVANVSAEVRSIALC